MTDSKSTPDTQAAISNKPPATPKKATAAKADTLTKTARATQSSSSANSTAAQPQSKTVEVKKPSNSATIFAFIFSLAALAGVGLTWYQNQVVEVRSESSIAVGIAEIGGQVSRIGDTVVRLQEQQTSIVSEDKLNASLQQTSIILDRKIEQLEQQQAQLIASIDTINSDLKSGVNAYVIDEVAQLLKLANNSLVFSSDPDSALNALNVAAAQLKTVGNPRYGAVRVKIAEEIALLTNLPSIDVEGIAAALNAIANSVPSLALENEPEASEVSFATQVAEEQTGWRTELSKLWNEIKSAIQIQRVEQAPKPLLAPDQRYFLDQNLQLMLSKAELALLQQRDTIFQQSIDSASQWLQDYFDLADPQVANVLTQLSQIREQQIQIDLPTISGSYELLQEIRGGQ